METHLQLPTQDNHLIHGTLRHHQQKTPSSTLIIFVHGFACSSRHQLILSGATFFAEQGYDTVRFDLYSSKPQARTLRESTILLNSTDLDTIIEHFSNSYQHIVLIGHSMGGPVIMNAQLPKVSKILLWDPTIRLTDPNEENPLLQYNEAMKCFILNWGIEILVPAAYFGQWEKTVGPSQFGRHTDLPIHLLITEKRTQSISSLPTRSTIHIHTMNDCGHDFESKEEKNMLFQKTVELLQST